MQKGGSGCGHCAELSASRSLLPNSELRLEGGQLLPPRARPQLRERGAGGLCIRGTRDRTVPPQRRLRRRPFVQSRFWTICWRRVLALSGPWRNSSGTGVLVKSGSRKPPKGRGLSDRRDGAPTAPAPPAGAAALGCPRARGSGQAPVWVGAPPPRCAPASHRRIPRILSPASGPCLRTREAFQTRAFKEPVLSLQAPFASSPPFLFPPDLLTREEGRRWREEGRKPVPAALSKKHNNPAQCRRAGFAPAEQRGALFSAVVSWPFDLSAAGEMLLLTFG